MQGDRQVIIHLNNVLYNQLTAINQYFLHARMLEDWGIDKLGEHIYKESIHQMKHADKVIKRILFLEGLPNLQQLGKLHIGENTQEILSCDLRMASDSHITIKAAIANAEQAADFVTRDLLRAIMAEEEEYIDWTGTQLALIESVTLENYIQSQIWFLVIQVTKKVKKSPRGRAEGGLTVLGTIIILVKNYVFVC